ncbi:WecB/TagA/CpsF family glycosyltransferase [Paracoccaceae bacterium Fryx2]|nr:WecB/TagA/CpsF family glycosyltransferase [Paracoccaceae bacterium Fryx2]
MEFRFDHQVIAVNLPDRAALESVVAARLSARQGFALATINLDHLVKLARSDRFRRAYAAQDLVVADGNPIIWLSRLAGRPVALVPGSDMVVPLARLAVRGGVAVALVGSTPDALHAAAQRLQTLVPGLRIVLTLSPPFGFDPEGPAAEAIMAEVVAAGAGLCLLALGAPKQELFAARARIIAPHVGFVSIGAGLDFLAGRQRRAPVWMRRLALEWLWRLALDPARLLPRYAACAAVIPGQMVAALRLRLRG